MRKIPEKIWGKLIGAGNTGPKDVLKCPSSSRPKSGLRRTPGWEPTDCKGFKDLS